MVGICAEPVTLARGPAACGPGDRDKGMTICLLPPAGGGLAGSRSESQLERVSSERGHKSLATARWRGKRKVQLLTW